MGACFSSSEKVAAGIKLVIVGTPGVGKSTIFKQMTLLYQNGFSEERRLTFVNSIIRNTVRGTLLALRVASELDLQLSDENSSNDEIFDLAALLNVQIAQSTQTDVIPISNELWRKLRAVWTEPAMLQALKILTNPTAPLEVEGASLIPELLWCDAEMRSRTEECVEYFVGHLKRISEVDYVPSNEDLLRLRRTTELPETIHYKTRVKLSASRPEGTLLGIQCTDVGGQLHHEVDWRRHIGISDAVIFVAALSEYCTILPDGKNALKNQLDLLMNVYSNKIVCSKPMVILLNKSDLLQNRLKHAKVRKFFPKYKGKNKEENVVKYFVKFIEKSLATIRQKLRVQSCVTVTASNALNSSLVEHILRNFFVAWMESQVMVMGLVN